MSRRDDEMNERINELLKLYDISEAERCLIDQLVVFIRMPGWSPRLTLKLLKAIVAIWEATLDVVDQEKKWR